MNNTEYAESILATAPGSPERTLLLLDVASAPDELDIDGDVDELASVAEELFALVDTQLSPGDDVRTLRQEWDIALKTLREHLNIEQDD